MARQRFDREIDYWILATANQLERVANEELGRHGITYRQVQVIGCIKQLGPMSQTELAERILLEPPTVVRLLDRMTRDGWVERVPSTTDRRVKIVVLTDQVEDVWKTVRRTGRRIRTRMTAGLDAEQLSMLNGILGQVWANLGGAALDQP